MADSQIVTHLSSTSFMIERSSSFADQAGLNILDLCIGQLQIQRKDGGSQFTITPLEYSIRGDRSVLTKVLVTFTMLMLVFGITNVAYASDNNSTAQETAREQFARVVNAERAKMFEELLEQATRSNAVFDEHPVVYINPLPDDALFVAFANLLKSKDPNVRVTWLSVRLHADKSTFHAATRTGAECREVLFGWRDGNARMESRLTRCQK